MRALQCVLALRSMGAVMAAQLTCREPAEECFPKHITRACWDDRDGTQCRSLITIPSAIIAGHRPATLYIVRSTLPLHFRANQT